MRNDAVINVALPLELKDKVIKCARSKNISLNSLVRLILTEYLEEIEKNEI